MVHSSGAMLSVNSAPAVLGEGEKIILHINNVHIFNCVCLLAHQLMLQPVLFSERVEPLK